MTSSVKQIVQHLNTDELREVVSDFDQLDEVGHIGDCKLREIAENLSTGSVVLAMHSVTLYAYRELYLR